MSIELKNIDLDNISLKEQLEKVAKETNELQHFLLNEPVENIISKFWNVVQANLGVLSKLGINADRVMEYYPRHLAMLEHKPSIEVPNEENEIGAMQYLLNAIKGYDWNKLKEGDFVIVKRSYWVSYSVTTVKEYERKYNCVNTKDDTFRINTNGDYIFPYTREVVDYINANCVIDLYGLPEYTPVYVRNNNDKCWVEDKFTRREKNGKYKTLKGGTWDEIKLRYDK